MTSRTTTMTRPYERATRVRMVRLVICQYVAGAAPGLDEAFTAAQCELASQPLHVDVDDIRQRVIRLVPDMLGDVAPADDDAGMAREELQQSILTRRQREVQGAAGGLLRTCVQRQRADLN